jgi:uncharacterized RDD family membrane protein YckC
VTDTVGYRSYIADDLVTGEGVAVEVPAATVAARLASGLIDFVVVVVVLIGGSIGLFIITANASEALIAAAFIGFTTVTIVGIPMASEILFRGRSLGKLALGLRVVRDDGGPTTARHALVRALVGYVEIYLLFPALLGAPAVVAAMIHPRAKRLGDMAAGTFVISQRARLRVVAPPSMPPQLAQWAGGADIAELPSGLTVSVRQFLARASSLAPESRHTLGIELLRSTMTHVSPEPPAGFHPEVVLAAVVAERRRRDGERLWRADQLRARVLPPDPLAPGH